MCLYVCPPIVSLGQLVKSVDSAMVFNHFLLNLSFSVETLGAWGSIANLLAFWIHGDYDHSSEHSIVCLHHSTPQLGGFYALR